MIIKVKNETNFIDLLKASISSGEAAPIILTSSRPSTGNISFPGYPEDRIQFTYVLLTSKFSAVFSSITEQEDHEKLEQLILSYQNENPALQIQRFKKIRFDNNSISVS